MKPIGQISLALLLFGSCLLGLEAVRHMTNSLGFRSHEFSPNKLPGVFRIIFIGASTTFGVGGPVEDTFPFLTGQLLNQNSQGLRVESLNAAMPGKNSYWLPIRLKEILPLEPDLVMVMIGENDCASIYQKFVDISRRGDLKVIPWQERLSAWIAAHSVLYVTAKEKLSIVLHGSPRFAFDSTAATKRLANEINPEWLRYYPKHFEQNIEKGIQIAQKRAVPLIFIQPPLSLKRRTEAPDYARAYDVLMERLNSVTRRRNTPIIPTDAFYADLEAGFGPDWDSIHLPKAANEKLARLIYQYFSKNNLLEELRRKNLNNPLERGT